ncbi:hypothetical protein LSH36_1094g00024 [Paralvinella palmiformis]|uniref:Small nuclear ribonucleoprotein E n=1 Tax=Paralvinella palmiformis TaxID=53620 RepID=A0AAD9IW66_9ANNE|nr:hypothetical protein LSH36_1094g00024 [Paralvinella palmiformis]
MILCPRFTGLLMISKQLTSKSVDWFRNVLTTKISVSLLENRKLLTFTWDREGRLYHRYTATPGYPISTQSSEEQYQSRPKMVSIQSVPPTLHCYQRCNGEVFIALGVINILMVTAELILCGWVIFSEFEINFFYDFYFYLVSIPAVIFGIIVWLYEQTNLRVEGHIMGFDEYMNLVLDEAEQVHMKNQTRRSLGHILLKSDNITLIQ